MWKDDLNIKNHFFCFDHLSMHHIVGFTYTNVTILAFCVIGTDRCALDSI